MPRAIDLFPKIKILPWLIALCLATLCLTWQTAHLKPRLITDYDQLLYLPLAHELATTGIFTDGRQTEITGHVSGSAGMFIAPLYPAFLAILSKIDHDLATTAACTQQSSDAMLSQCQENFGILRPLQFLFATVNLLLLWQIARVIGGPVCSWIALLAACLLCHDYAEYANLAMTENLTLPLFTGFNLCLIKAVRHQSDKWALLSGILLGLCNLTRPEYLYLTYSFIPVILLLYRFGRSGDARRLLLIALCSFAVVTPWLIRNAILFHSFELTQGYGGLNLAQRMAYQAMTWQEWFIAWVFYLPDFGDTLAQLFFNPASYTRLDYTGRPDTFYQVGYQIIAPASLIAAGGPDHQIGYLFRTYALGQPFKFFMVTLLLSWRCLWVSKYLSLLGAPLLAIFTIGSIYRRQAAIALALVLPSLILLLLHGAVSNGHPRYNLIMVPAMATGIGVMLAPYLLKLKARLK